MNVYFFYCQNRYLEKPDSVIKIFGSIETVKINSDKYSVTFWLFILKGNNSSLHALTSLQHQSSSGLNNHHNLMNSGQMNGGNGSSNGSGHGGSQQHQSNLLNFNMSPSSSSNHGILSALSLSSTAGNSLQNQLLSASGKPLRSERLPNHIVDEIVKQAKIRRRNGGKKEVGDEDSFFSNTSSCKS